jgi:hypothetical protein
MDPHDAILEQLQRAQKRALEAMTNRLDFVVERLDDLLKEARSEIKEAVPQDAEELFPLAEIASEVEKLKAQAGSGQGAAPTTSLFSVVAQLEQATSQSELLKDLLPVIQTFAARAVVLVVRGEAIQAWSGIGFTDGERLKAWQAEIGASEAFTGFAKDMKTIRLNPKDDAVFKGWLAEEGLGEEAIVAPVVLRGSLVGGIYADRLPGRPWQPETVQLLVAVACWLIDTLQVRSGGSRLLTRPEDLRTETGSGTDSPEELELELEEPQEEPAEVEFTEVEPVEDELDELEAADEVVAPSPEEVLQQSEEFDPSATMRVEVPPSANEVTQTIPENGAGESVGEPPEHKVEEVSEASSETATGPDAAPVEEPPPVSAVVPPDDPPPVSAVVPPEPEPDGSGAGGGDDQKVEEARRFARLLVSEIKLYNEEEIDKGKVSGDIYNRLKEDIDRSREMFEKRISPDAREGRDLFREELVRILADGDDSALGM